MKSDAEIIRKLLLDYTTWLLKDEPGEGHEEEYVDHYLTKRKVIGA